MEELKYWFRHDKFNISLTLLCALISLLPSLLPHINESEFPKKFDFSLLKACSQLLIAITGFIWLSMRFKPMALNELSARESLQDYIDDVCAIRQTKGNDSHFAYKVVKAVVKQFYNMWMVVWAVWVINYSMNVLDLLIGCQGSNPYVQSIGYLFDFIGSAAMFAIYVILSDVTVEISQRTGKRYSDLHWYVIAILLLFALLVLLYINYEVGCSSQAKSYIELILSSFGCFSFVMVLGKLNSNFLNVPKLFMIMLYCYAVAQAYSFLALDSLAKSSLTDFFKENYYYFTSIGKVMLIITLSWILSRKRLIFYLINRSLSMTDVRSRLNEFNRYMG